MLREATVGIASSEIDRTLDAIAAVQLPSGCIPWWTGRHADTWNHVEAAMALDEGGRHDGARRAYAWLLEAQRSDGSWAAAYVDGKVTDATIDTNFCAYVATGLWHHHVLTGDVDALMESWTMVERAIDYVLALQMPGGEILWARDAGYRPWPGALLTSCSSIYLSVGCAIAIAEVLGFERPDWDVARATLRSAIVERPQAFEPKERFAMDWYYPVLTGVLRGDKALARLEGGWDAFVIEGRGVRCVSDRPWVTGAETGELALALMVIGLNDRAEQMMSWVEHLRDADGAYWTGATWPEGVVWPVEKTTWSAAAVVLASRALEGEGAVLDVCGSDLNMSSKVPDAL